MHRISLSSILLSCFLFAFVRGPQVVAAADDTDDEDSRPGLAARYSAGEKRIERVDRDVQFAWDADSPDARIAPGPFSARWTGRFLIRTEGRHAFHLFLAGEASVTLNGKTVVAGRHDAPGWVVGEAGDVEFGEQKLDVAYRKTGERAVMRLFWSSESFPTEPIPPQLLFHDASHPDIDFFERGRDLYETHRCQACHRRDHEPAPLPAPALVGTSLDRGWLIDWLLAPHKQAPRASMPGFGFSRDEARAVAEYLTFKSGDEPLPDPPTAVEGDAAIRLGETLFRSVGCLACHTRGSEGTAAALGGDLTNVGRKRTAGWLDIWLKDPAKLNADHRMPVFKLADDERRNLAVFLAGAQPEIKRPRAGGNAHDAALVARGKALIEKARCAACHRIADFKADTRSIPALSKPAINWTNACTESAGDPERARPDYSFSAMDRQAIRAYVESRPGLLAKEGVFNRGQRLLKQKGCLNCHERDGGKGIGEIAGAMARLDADLAGQSEALVPPDLTAVGDKLRDEPLALAFSGRQKTTRLPWLRVRMPRFEHQPAEAEALAAFLIGHDRIPEGAPHGPAPAANAAAEKLPNRSEISKAGQVLAGTRGFSCTACHQIAAHTPRNVALATRGSDLFLVGERMRPEFFIRWTRSPLRIVPGMEMPSFERPIPGILEGKLDRQLAALWIALNDKSSPPKIDTSTIEQVLTVAPGDSAKIIRDVFNVGDALAPKFVPRALAIGFDNGASVLFDLDTMSFRAQWFGEFARQRSSGKSWFWEPAASTPIVPGWDSPDIALRATGNPDGPIINARRESGRFGRLVNYARSAVPADFEDAGSLKGVRLNYTLPFDLRGQAATLAVSDLFFPALLAAEPKLVFCQRDVRVSPAPKGYEVVLRIARGADEAVQYMPLTTDPKTGEAVGGVGHSSRVERRSDASPPPTQQPPSPKAVPVTSVPGYDGVRLPLPGSIMPTALTWTAEGTLAFSSLKGEVYLVKDTDGDGIEDRLTIFEEGLAAPYGLIADGNDLIVAHKPELLRLRDTDGDGRADVREVVADGWGYTEDYHDWTMGIVRDSHGNLYVGTGSDYAKPGRDREKSRWRGKVLRIDRNGAVTPVGHAFRYPTGLAITPDDQVFVSDNQGVQNTFNEINHLVTGASYGVPSLYEKTPGAVATPPAIQVPHPWTRSVNGIFFLPANSLPDVFAGHGIGCEYDNRFLVRFTLQRVGKTYQGAVYPFSLPTPASARDGFIGTLCGAVSPAGDIYIGSVHDSGWLGGTNVGDIVRLRPNGKLPAGIREIRAAAGRFLISFTAAIDRKAAARSENYEISGYTRKWQGTYATPDSGRHKLDIESVAVAADGLSIVVHTSHQQEGHVYEITCGKIGPAGQTTLWPSAAYYTLNEVPE